MAWKLGCLAQTVGSATERLGAVEMNGVRIYGDRQAPVLAGGDEGYGETQWAFSLRLILYSFCYSTKNIHFLLCLFLNLCSFTLPPSLDFGSPPIGFLSVASP